MRPIDADAFIRHIIDDNDGYLMSDRLSVMDIENYVDNTPTIDVKPVVHAHWYFDPDKPIGCGITVGGMFCSNCGGNCQTGSHPYRDFKYCPYCGARMDEEV